jgi:hypothetical protein
VRFAAPRPSRGRSRAGRLGYGELGERIQRPSARVVRRTDVSLACGVSICSTRRVARLVAQNDPNTRFATSEP